MTNGRRILATNLYDTLLRIHDNLAVRNTVCVLEALDKNLRCQRETGTCAECIQEWLNAEEKKSSGGETCVCCGEIIPEGRQVCRRCEEG